MMKWKKYFVIPITVIVCIAVYAVVAKPAIDTHAWVLSVAQKAEPFSVVAHKKGYDFSDDDSNLFAFSKEIELICEAKNGKIILADKTKAKTYEGTYKIKSWNRFKNKSYSVVIDGVEGTATISSGFAPTLFVSIGGYYLNFEIR